MSSCRISAGRSQPGCGSWAAGGDAEGEIGWLPLSMNAAGEVVSDAALREALDLPPKGVKQAIARSVGESGLCGAFFRVPAQDHLELPLGYGRWLQRQQEIRGYDAARRATSSCATSCCADDAARGMTLSGAFGCY